ncbi:MAG: helix-turn-helix transcriptional regulator [Elusimicrobia bacterium]|nr:helix-turn-helix transcriptional regulator [Elusimicrobiota bacterium]
MNASPRNIAGRIARWGKGKSGFCDPDRRDHFGLCTTLRVDTSGYYEHSQAEHPGIELCFAVGDTRHQRHFRGRSWVVADDALMVFNARERHVEECSANPDLRDLRAVIVHPGFVDSLLADAGMNTDELVFDEALLHPAPPLRHALDALFAAAAAPGTSHVAIDCALTELVIELTTRLKHSASAVLRTLGRRGYYPGLAARARAILRDEMGSQDLDLQQIASRAGLSKFHFVRAFRDKTGITPIQYLNRLRIDVAKQKLQPGAQAVTEIAFDVGFADISAFNKAFQRHAGISPTQYRNIFRARA